MTDDQGLLWSAVSDALGAVARTESEWEKYKLGKKVREYFKKAARGLQFKQWHWRHLVNEYADCALSSLFQGLSDRPWIQQADFLLALDAGVKENFPREVLKEVPRMDFETAVLVAHDRAFEEQRYLPLLWETVQAMVTKVGRAGRRVYDAADIGRKAAVGSMGQHEDPNEVKAFVSRWADSTISNLSRFTHGHPGSVLPEEMAVQLFHALVESGGLPYALVAMHGPPPGSWPFVDYAVHMAYVAHGINEPSPAAMQASTAGGASSTGEGQTSADDQDAGQAKEIPPDEAPSTAMAAPVEINDEPELKRSRFADELTVFTVEP